MRERWKNPAFRERMSALYSERMKTRWRDPEFRKLMEKRFLEPRPRDLSSKDKLDAKYKRYYDELVEDGFCSSDALDIVRDAIHQDKIGGDHESPSL